MFFAFFISASFCQVAKLNKIWNRLVFTTKWRRVWPWASLSNFFFLEKTGSGKSGKNPDMKFREFLDRYCYLNIPWDDIWIIAKFFLSFSTILMFLKLPFFNLQMSLWTNMSRLIFPIKFGFIIITNNRFL